MQRRSLLVVALVLSVAFAGCTGGSTAPTTTQTEGDATTVVPSGADGGNDGGGSGSGDTSSLDAGQWNLLSFDRPTRFTYDLYTADEGTGTLVWDVTKVEGDQVTLHLIYDLGDVHYETTTTGAAGTVNSQLFSNPAGALLLTSMVSPASAYAGRDLHVGLQWSYSSPDGSASYAVTGTDSYAGVECFTSEMRHNGSVVREDCLNPNLGLAPYTVYYDADGTVVMKMELVGYETH